MSESIKLQEIMKQVDVIFAKEDDGVDTLAKPLKTLIEKAYLLGYQEACLEDV